MLNSDSYTGSLTHNYYLTEINGQLRMIAWDYNLAFGGMGGFGMGGDLAGMFTNPNVEQTTVQAETIDDATTYVNYPIDSPLLSGTIEERPMISWIFQSETYLEKYHDVYAEYIEYFAGGKFVQMYDSAIALISPYIKRDPTAFCSYDEYMNGSATLREFCLLRAESISRQLDDLIRSTSEDQTATNHSHFVDASGIDMGSMGSDSMGFGGERGQ